MSVHDVVTEIRRATKHHGVCRVEALRLSSGQITRACRSGLLERRHAAVYVDPSAPRTPMQDLAVAVAAGGRLAAGWARSSGAVWALVGEHPPMPEIVIPWQRHACVDGAVVHRSVDLCPEHLVRRNGVRVTNPLVTTLDLGVVLSPIEIADVIVRARQLHLYEPPAVDAILAKLGRCGRTGVRNARAARELVMIGDRPADSVLELRFHHGPGTHGLPPYEYQHEVRIGNRRYYIDFAYPELMVAIEVDGYEKRMARESLDRDAERGRKLALAGWQILRFTWTQVVGDPAGVAREILALLGMQAAGIRA